MSDETYVVTHPMPEASIGDAFAISGVEIMLLQRWRNPRRAFLSQPANSDVVARLKLLDDLADAEDKLYRGVL